MTNAQHPMCDRVHAIKAAHTIFDRPFFSALSANAFSREDFVETQIQFLHAVVYFSRPMLALAARLPSAAWRAPLLENADDEHGAGDFTRTHEQTFLALLRVLGVEAPQIDERAMWPEVRAFNTALMGACALDDPLTGLAMLGMIEDMFAGISGFLGEAIIMRGWAAREELVHYCVHEQLDLEHAEDFYRPLRAAWDTSARAAYQITQGLELGAYIFMQLYDGLFAARARRVTRDVRGPHSLADGWSVSG